MIKTQPHILEHEGKPAFVVLPMQEYEAMCRRLEDLEDLELIREAELADAGLPARPLKDVLKELGLSDEG